MGFFEQNEEDKVDNSLWTEAYRPTRLVDYVGNAMLKEKVSGYLENGDIPHLLLYGRAGTGKTTLAKLIVKSVECDYMIINASDENNVETVRNKVKGFASSMGFKKYKIVILDEFDCNYVEKVIEPIQSRCQTFQIIPPTKKDVAIQISKILGNENVSFQPKDLVPIIDAGYPDIRKIINTCQLNSIKGELKVDTKNLLENDYKIKVLDILKSSDDKRNKYSKVRQAIIDSRSTDFSELFTLLYEKVDEYAPNNTANVIITLSDGQNKHFNAIDKEIPTAATLIEILNLI